MHHTGFVDKLTIERLRAGVPMPGLDAEKRSTCGLRPHPELTKPFPANLDRWTASGRVANRIARGPIQDDRIFIEQSLCKREDFTSNCSCFGLCPQETVFQSPNG